MEDAYEALYQALNNPTVSPARRTFGTVEYVFVPVAAVEGVLDDVGEGWDDAPGPDATVEPAAEESFDPPTGAGTDMGPINIPEEVIPTAAEPVETIDVADEHVEEAHRAVAAADSETEEE